MAENSKFKNEKNDKLKELLNNACSKVDNKYELIKFLEGNEVFTEPLEMNISEFCNKYLIVMVDKFASKNDYDFILLSCNLLEPYSELQTDTERFERYALDAFGLNKSIRKGWADIVSSIDKKRKKIIDDLAQKLYAHIYEGEKKMNLGLIKEAKTTKCPADPKYCRKYYSKNEVENGCLDNRFVLNSIVDAASGIDERKYMQACVSHFLPSGKWQEEIINPEDGKEYYVLLRIYKDNPEYSADSEEITIEIAFRKAYGDKIRLDGIIKFGQNPQTTCWDFVKFKSDKKFHLEYVNGSAVLCADDSVMLCSEVYKEKGLPLNDNIINYTIKKDGGIKISDSDLSLFCSKGNRCVVMVKVRAVYTNYTVTHQLRGIKSSKWTYTIDARPYDEIEFMITYECIGTDSSKNDESENGGHDISIKEQLADGLEYVVGSTYTNGNHEESDNICGDGLTIDDRSVTITFKAKVTAQAIGENKCCVVVNGIRAESTTVIVDNSAEITLLTANENETESDVSCDSEDNTNDNLAEYTLVSATSEVASEKDTTSSSDIVNNNEQSETDCNINPVVIATNESKDIPKDKPQIQPKGKKDKKPSHKLYILVVAVAIIVVFAGIVFFKSQSNENAVPSEGSDSMNQTANTNPNDEDIFDSPLDTSEKPDSEEEPSSKETSDSGVEPGSEEISISASIPNLEIEPPEGLSREINGDGRSSYTAYQINRGILGNKIVFNSIGNSSPIGGDERNFVAAREDTADTSGAADEWNTSDVVVENGKGYVIRLYVHNNNPGGLDTVATNTKVAFDIPSYSAKQIQVNAFISADNAEPNIYWGHVNFIANQAFHLKYDYGSALLENEGVGKDGGVKLSDNIITKKTNGGELIGYDSLDGCVPGGYEYHNYVTIRVRAVFDTDYTIDNEVRLVGGADIWDNYVVAEIGDIVEFRISYQNLHKTENQDHVAIKDILPKNLRYVPGTTKLVNAEHLNGIVVSPDGIILSGLSISKYGPNANAYIYLRAEVVDDGLACGNNTLTNWAQGSVGVVTIQDYANVVVNKPYDTLKLTDADIETMDSDVN